MLQLAQTLQLSPSLLQSMQVLQMNTQELSAYLTAAAEENPTLEEDPAFHRDQIWAELQAKAPWLPHSPRHSPASDTIPEGVAPGQFDDRAFLLRDQLGRLNLSPPLAALTGYLAALLDEDGYLDADDLDDLRQKGVPDALLSKAVETLQSLEPAGIAARDLSECLTLQLRRLPGDQSLCLAIIQQHWDSLSRGRLDPIVKATGCSKDALLAAQATIKALNPHPGRDPEAPAPTVYIQPDAWVVEVEGTLQLYLNDWDYPRFQLSGQYLDLAASTKDAEVQSYLQERLRKARWLLHCVARRSDTLALCFHALLDHQQDYFTGSSEAIAPLTQYQLADGLGLHPSTVSRAIRNKYLQSRQGLFPVSRFFSRKVGGGAAPQSEAAVKARIAAWIRAEDPSRPLSDQDLVENLSAQGLRLARRTVAKYRAAMGIPGSFQRRSRYD